MSIAPAAFSPLMSNIFEPLIRNNKAISYLDDIFIQEKKTMRILTISLN